MPLRSVLLFISLLAIPARGEDRPECEPFRPGKSAVDAPQKDEKKFAFQYTAGCSRGGAWKRVEASPPMQKFLNGMAQKRRQRIAVYSCFRSPENQKFILCNNRCLPDFGDQNCAGRIAPADKSQHSLGTAADFQLQTAVPILAKPDATKKEISAWNVKGDQELKKICLELAQNRQEITAGRGGITVYGIERTNGKAGLHYDTMPDWCNWGACEKFLGEGHCKRTKFEAKVAQLEGALAAAKVMEARVEVSDLAKQLAALKADCPPGDEACRDSFQ